MASTDQPAATAIDTAPARPDVFVSYSRKDKTFVERTLWPALVERGKDAVDVADAARPSRALTHPSPLRRE